MIVPVQNEFGMSTRGFGNVGAIMPKISAQVAERTNLTNTRIDLSTAENHLVRSDVIEIYKEAIQDHLESGHLSYPNGFAGDPLLVSTLANFLNSYFDPIIPVEQHHIVTAPGAAKCLETLLFNICDPGDAVLVPSPYWAGFDFQFKVVCAVEPLAVDTNDPAKRFTSSLILALRRAMADSTKPVRALVLTNPHNPSGKMYPREVLEECVKFCGRHNIHYISDEVYALSSFQSTTTGKPSGFISALNLDPTALQCDPSLVHTIWSPSKDFGSSGIRMGCIITQSNMSLVVGAALSANTQVSSLSAIATVGLLSSPKLSAIIQKNSKRLAAAYGVLTSFLTRHNLTFIPAESGLFIFAQIAPHAQSPEEEDKVIARIRDAGVLVGNGRAYHLSDSENGWARITFAVEPEQLSKALKILSSVFDEDKLSPGGS